MLNFIKEGLGLNSIKEGLGIHVEREDGVCVCLIMLYKHGAIEPNFQTPNTTADELNQIADKLEELRGLHTVEGKDGIIYLYKGTEQIGYFYKEVRLFSITARRELTLEEQEKVNEIIYK